MITTYKQSEHFLNSFVDYEKIANFSYNESINLQRMNWLVEILNIKLDKLKVIHIAGTKGKGSTAWLCAQMLASAGLKVGIYTSPHFYDFRERIQIVRKVHSPQQKAHSKNKREIKKQLITKKDVVRIVNAIESKFRKNKLQKIFGKISFFELYTAIAFKYFLEKGVDFAVIETGLGGRLDATNVVKPDISVITHIGYDHTSQLGESLTSIAKEKAGIIKEAGTLICAAQERQALNVIKLMALNKACEFFLYNKDFRVSDLLLTDKYTSFKFWFKNQPFKKVKLKLKGVHQIENAACALAAMSLLQDKGIIGGRDYHKGIYGCLIDGRFEKVSDVPLIIIDIAHNPSSFAALKDSLSRYYRDKKVIFIFGCSQDKDFKLMLNIIKPAKLILTRSSNPRSADPNQIKKKCKNLNAEVIEDVTEALTKAFSYYSKDSIIVVSGSVYLAAEARKVIKVVDRRPGFFNNLKYNTFTYA
jgi:dihydrofolate synthase / folylpolyglutamate synthase